MQCGLTRTSGEPRTLLPLGGATGPCCLGLFSVADQRMLSSKKFSQLSSSYFLGIEGRENNNQKLGWEVGLKALLASAPSPSGQGQPPFVLLSENRADAKAQSLGNPVLQSQTTGLLRHLSLVPRKGWGERPGHTVKQQKTGASTSCAYAAVDIGPRGSSCSLWTLYLFRDPSCTSLSQLTEQGFRGNSRSPLHTFMDVSRLRL